MITIYFPEKTVIGNSTPSQISFSDTLPTRFRPTSKIEFPIWVNDGAAWNISNLQIFDTGIINICNGYTFVFELVHQWLEQNKDIIVHPKDPKDYPTAKGKY
jgi:hypothetical protein